MTTPINLNKQRKAKARAERRAQADRNAVVHGLSKAQKDAARKAAAREAIKLDGKRRDDPEA